MHQFANGSSAAVSLLGGGESGPPVGPETVGRAPSGYDASPIPLRPFPTSVAKAPAETQPEAEAQLEAHPEWAKLNQRYYTATQLQIVADKVCEIAMNSLRGLEAQGNNLRFAGRLDHV